MIPLTFKRMNGNDQVVPMDQLVRLGDGLSEINKGWASTLVYSKELDALIELSEGEPDYRGNSPGAAIEVSRDYAARVYGVKL